MLDWLLPTLLSFAAMFTRLWQLDLPDFVVWDEFGSHYLKSEFYHDVHPPLGKMLVAFAGMFAGYDGSFGFESGHKYPETVNYAGMRRVIALFGAIIVPIAYMTAVNLGFSRRASFLVGLMVLLDNGLLVVSRLILLDPILLCFTSLAFFSLSAFHSEQPYAFGLDWWFWLLATGVFLGMVASVKWVGFFTVALVGVYTIEDLYNRLRDSRKNKISYIQHWLGRIIGLILIPLGIYALCFVLHFSILNRSGPGDTQMSSLFQANLVGSDLMSNPLDVAYGSYITLKNNALGGGLLHSHVQIYPEGSKQQQITCYHHKDDNNHWQILQPRERKQTEEFVLDGDVIRLIHNTTEANLHAHQVTAHVAKKYWETSGYGNRKVGDYKDYWKIEMINPTSDRRIKSLTTGFRLRHIYLGCLLGWSGEQYPAWGFTQHEVVCGREEELDNTIWNVEWHRNDKLEAAPRQAYKTNFWEDLVTINKAMWTTNNALVPDDNKKDDLASDPHHWPLLLKGIRMSSWDDNALKLYMFGNPVGWWTSTASIVFYGLYTLYNQVRKKRGKKALKGLEKGKWIVIGWFLHYAPFYLMGRVTYLHHYMPALYFALFMPALVAEYILGGWGVAALAVAEVWSFWFFHATAYGIEGPAAAYANRAWLSSWTMS